MRLQRGPTLESRFTRDDLLSLAEWKLQLQRLPVRELPVARQPANAASDGVVACAMPADELLGELSIGFERGHRRTLLYWVGGLRPLGRVADAPYGNA